jgi:peptidoglycan/xylan/chitin deacetylase (PgdA/CDA1 family)
MTRSDLARAATAILGHPWMERTSARVTARHLRIVAYHGIPDPAVFARQLDHIRTRYAPVSGAAVARAVELGGGLPSRAVWVTFDDGRPDAVDVALPLLVRRQIPATLFVCPGVVGTTEPFWWDVVESAVRLGVEPELDGRRWSDPKTLVRRLKTLSDRKRRAFVAELRCALDAHRGCASVQLSVDQLREWVSHDYEVGNHSWDHPCLDRCTPSEQEWQVMRAHEGLRDLLGRRPDLFAYPNGNWASETDRVVRRLGYRVALLCDHRLVGDRPDRFRLSRLRVDSDASLPRTRAILSGAHPAAFHAAGRITAWSRARR